ncbi:hypothetical protein [Leptospira wolbachii]|uniref:hypothetical protein n=1 Tax=Leptospira wolbachii TaxID=29511 RepID=UPI001E40461B|nr:hypothetical protein [Leptospira wolbachii]
MIFAFLFSFYIFGPNFKAKFWLIDDHEIFFFLGSVIDQNGWSDFLSTLVDRTEVGLFGVSTRYRPSYYFLRLVEVFLWKDNAILWYLFRFFILVSFVYSLNLLFRFFLSTPVALAWTITCFSFTYWSDIYSRLGPGETYVTLGFAIFITVTFTWERRIRYGIFTAVLQVLALVIMIGSKENMVLVAFLPIFFLYDKDDLKYKFKYYHILYLIPFLVSMVIVLAVIKATSLNPVDINGNSAQISDRLSRIVGFMNNSLFLQPLILGFLLCVGLIVKTKSLRIVKKSFQIISILIFLIINILLNIVFYGGELPQNNRYDFPTAVINVFYFIIILSMVLRLIFPKKIVKNELFSGIIFLIFSAFGFSSYSINEIQNASRKNAKRTQSLDITIRAMKLEAAENVGIIFVRNFTEFEPADSILRYANYNHLQLRIGLDVDDVMYYSSFQDGLMSYLRNLSINGDDTRSLKPLGNLKKEKILSCNFYHFGEISFDLKKKYPFCKQIKAQLISY